MTTDPAAECAKQPMICAFPEGGSLVRLAYRELNIAAHGTTLNSDALEEWHRYALPAFIERMRTRIKDHCEEGHQRWPASSRYARHTNDTARRDGTDTYSADVQTS